jgi:small GTP-binding protein
VSKKVQKPTKMTSIEEKIAQIEEEIRITPYHKGTEHYIGRLKARLARLREEQEKRPARGRREGFAIKKAGDATCVLIGFPSVGKSTLLNKLTSASSKVAPYEFTTLTVIPGMLTYQGAKIQILDIPGLISGAADGKGQGKQIISIARNADLLLLITEVEKLNRLKTIYHELSSTGIRINQAPPKVSIKRTQKGGLKVTSSIPLTQANHQTIKEMVSEFRLVNAEIKISEDVSLDQLVDTLLPNRVYLPALVVVNKIDFLEENELLTIREELKEIKQNLILISAEKEIGLEKLKQKIWEKLGLIRIYLKPKGGKADLEKPLILTEGQTLANVLKKIPPHISEGVKSALLWGPSASYPGQEIGLSRRLLDQDTLTIATK